MRTTLLLCCLLVVPFFISLVTLYLISDQEVTLGYGGLSGFLKDFFKPIGLGLVGLMVLGALGAFIFWPYRTAHKPKEREAAKNVSLKRAKKIVLTIATIWILVWGGQGVIRWWNKPSTITSETGSKLVLPSSTSRTVKPGDVTRQTKLVVTAEKPENSIVLGNEEDGENHAKYSWQMQVQGKSDPAGKIVGVNCVEVTEVVFRDVFGLIHENGVAWPQTICSNNNNHVSLGKHPIDGSVEIKIRRKENETEKEVVVLVTEKVPISQR
ncbi:MAG: hypothetical protein AAB505_02535 [Patescibacteria group bacterium]